ncbi:hypothetical protein BASA81_011698 [Batrachochytrium salamandrivorans]|nr:hypothetical protein BASA81_011698 [Batrachochytrium salamandrivorans]
MSVCAITIYKVISRAGPRSSIDKIADASTNLIFYREITVLASTMGETEHALEYATKLVAFHEIAVAESLGGFDIDSAAGDADMAALKTNTTTSLDERPLPRKASINLNAHFDAQILLADASMKATNYATAVHAFTRAIQLFDLQDSMATEEDTNSPSSLDNILELKRRLHLKKEICLKLVDANENLKGDASVSFIYSRTICELCTTKAVDDSDFFTEKEAVDYMFMAGVYAYRYALQLAGGVEHASSPPVAILATPNAQKTMPIRTILDESIQYLLKSQHNATLDTSDPKSKRSISFQLAILYTDIREEEKARALLKEFGLTNTVLHEIDLHRRRSRSNNTGEGYSLSLISPFEHVVYSLEAFKRLVGLSPSAESLTESATPFRLTLSSNRRMTIAGDHFLPIKAVCAHCCMTFTSDDPIKCSECATQRIYVYYCTEECATENKSTHDQDCIKGNTLGNSSEFSLTGMTGTFSTLLNGNL